MKPYKKTATVQVQNLAQSIRAITKRDDVFTEQVRDYALANGIKIHQGAGYLFVLGEDAERIRAAFVAGETETDKIAPEPMDEGTLLDMLRVVRHGLEKFGWHITITQ